MLISWLKYLTQLVFFAHKVSGLGRVAVQMVYHNLSSLFIGSPIKRGSVFLSAQNYFLSLLTGCMFLYTLKVLVLQLSLDNIFPGFLLTIEVRIQMQRIKPKHIKYIRPVVGFIVFILGAIFMFFPFIPLGYLLLAAGLFLMAYEIPFLKKFIDKLKRRDKKDRIEKVEEKVEEAENVVSQKIENANSENNQT